VPRILVYLSDEWGATPDVHRRTTKIPLVLRQYHHSHYVRATNVRQIPLGFMNTMFDDPYSLPDVALATQRRYRWCFVGGMKADRAEALEAFEPWGPSFCDPCPPHELARAYQASIFVPCPLGNVVMDCFRNYEATVCGAIPVVAGCSKREFQQNFAEVGVPPWIRARTWRQAQRICADLERTGAINELQRACLQWWRNEITAVQDAIADVLDLPEKAVSAANLSAPPLRSVLRWKLSSIARNGTGWRRRAARALTSIIG